LIRRLVLATLAAALPVVAVVASSVLPSAAPRAAATSANVNAYWLVASDGGIFSFGGAQFYGSTGGTVLNRPVVGMAATHDGAGYWLVASDGGIFSYGDAQFYGSTGAMRLNRPVVGMAPTADSGGYWLVASDGGIFSYGDAHFYGSTGAMRLNQPVVGMAATPDGGGYWLVAADGGIFSYGDAQFYGSTGSIHLNQPIIGMLPGPGGQGYFLVASDGGMFSYGNTNFFGSLGGVPIKHPIVSAATTPTADGYWMTDATGLVSNFGSADYFGSAPSPLFRPIVGMAEAPGTGGFFGGSFPSGSYGYDISNFQCNGFPTGAHTIGIVEVEGKSFGTANPCMAQEASWAGGGLNLYIFLTYGASTTNEPGCNGDQACNAGYQVAMDAYQKAVNAGVDAAVPWWLDVEPYDPSPWSQNTQENANFVQGAINALHETNGVADVGIYTSAALWNGILGNYAPSVPYWMADYLSSPSGPGSCADYANWVAKGQHLPSPPQIVQYNSAQFDEDYAC
jgi:hypothetical protein